MINRNLRHLRLFLAVVETGSPSAAARRHRLSQPAVTQAMRNLRQSAGGALFERRPQGFFPTARARLLAERTARALAILDPALAAVAPRLALTATTAGLEALAAVGECENFTLAAARLGMAQPTVHRAVTRLERDAGRPLFERASFGVAATRPCQALARAARLAFAELDQADAELAEFDGREAGRIVIGALPLSRSRILPRALAAFRERRPTYPITVLDGPYDDLLAGLRRGDIDLIVGALREPAPVDDVEEEKLFDDRLAVIAGRRHPLAARERLTPADLAAFPFVVARSGTPARRRFEEAFALAGCVTPARIIESGSILLMRELLAASDHLGCISGQQAEAEIAKGLVVRLDIAIDGPGRAIGLTTRAGWAPTPAQTLFADLVRAAAR
ncbi:MAG: LysR family transcriptional regulator [Flavobacteriaceae bacterium]